MKDEINICTHEQDVWFWAKGNNNEEKLALHMKDMQAKFTPFTRQFVSLDPVKLKKTQKREVLAHELTEFLKAEKEVTRLIGTVMELQARHQVVPQSASKRQKR